MNVWFMTSNSRGLKKRLKSSSVSPINTSLPTITEHRKRYGDDFNDENSEESRSINTDLNASEFSFLPRETKMAQTGNSSIGNSRYGEASVIKKRNEGQSSSSDTKSEQNEEEENFSFSKHMSKSVKFAIDREPIINTGTRQSYGAKDSENLSESESADVDNSFYGFRPVRHDEPLNFLPLDQNSNNSSKTPIYLSKNNESRSRSIQPPKPSSGYHQEQKTRSILNRTGRSFIHTSAVRNYSARGFEEESEWAGARSKRSVENKNMGSVGKTTGRKQNIKEHIVSIIEYCSNQVGIAIYNTVNGEIHLCQIIERLTYFRTISTIERFFPLEVIYSTSLEHTPLIKKLTQKFRNVNFRSFKRIVFDQTKGFQIYNQRGNKEEYNPDNKFIAYSALSALIYYLQNSYETKFNYNSLKIKWHLLEDLLIIESQTILELEIFLNGETKSKTNCFVDNFVCLTHGGTRMLRANLLQPLSNQKAIKERQELVSLLLQDKVLYEILNAEIAKFKNFEIITAKFIQSPKEKNIKSLKTYLSAIYSLSHLCLLLKKFHYKIEPYIQKKPPIISKLFSLINDFKINQLRENIEVNFDEEVLRNYENNKSGKKENFIFLFKMEKLGDDFIEVLRITYSHTMEDILKIFKEIKDKSKHDLKLLYNEFRGYYIKSNKKINLAELSEKIEDDIIQINEKKECILFSTSIMVSLNNRLKESEKKLVLISQNLLKSIIEDIQKNIDVLFDINYEISIVDMLLSFVGFIKKFQMVKFSKPILRNNQDTVVIEGLKTIWTNQSKFKISEEINLKVEKDKRVYIFEKTSNSFDQLNILYSIGYLTILTQIGCYVPASNFITDIYCTLMSKINLTETIESNLSHFQLELYHFKSIMDNTMHHNNKCLILLDELIKGTQYEEQISLSMAVLNQLCRLKGKSIVLISDLYQLKIIAKISSIPQFIFMKDGDIEKEQQKEQVAKRNRITQAIEKEKSRFVNPIQIQYAKHNNSLEDIMVRLNFSEDFIGRFNKLSIQHRGQNCE